MSYDDLTQTVMGDYRSFLSALTGLYLGVTTPGATVTPQTLASVSTSAHALAKTFIARAESEMTRYAAALGVDPLTSAWFATALSGVHVTVAQNIKTVMKRLRGAGTSPAAMLKNATGGMGLLVQSRLGALDFRASDAGGRMFEANTIMRTTIRQFAVQTAVDAVVLEAAGRSQDVVFIERADASPEEVSIAGKRGYLSLEEARKRVFHPNTKAVLHV
jgi:hypothetical protein